MTDYLQIADSHLAKISKLQEQRREIDEQIAKARELVKAVVNMLPDAERNAYLNKLGDAAIRQMGLTEAIREILQKNAQYLEPTAIRNILTAEGFDFSQYTSNPLSSIYSILKRFKKGEVETISLTDGSTGYRWKGRKQK